MKQAVQRPLTISSSASSQSKGIKDFRGNVNLQQQKRWLKDKVCNVINVQLIVMCMIIRKSYLAKSSNREQRSRFILFLPFLILNPCEGLVNKHNTCFLLFSVHIFYLHRKHHTLINVTLKHQTGLFLVSY